MKWHGPKLTLRFHRERNRRRTDEMLGLFQNLFSLEDQILNMFVPRQRAVQRYLFAR